MTKKYNIVIAGDSQQVHMACAYLAKELHLADVQLTPIIVADNKDGVIKHAFTPFTPILSPLAQRHKKSQLKGFESLFIQTKNLPQQMPFNFNNYGEPSTAVNFHQALQVCQQYDETTPALSAFLSRDQSTFGITYHTQEAQKAFQQYCNQQDIYTVCTQAIAVEQHNGSITKITTKEGQTISADLYIDCSSEQVIMRCIQAITHIEPHHIPPYTVESQLSNNNSSASGCIITSGDNRITCSLQTANTTECRTYHFENSEQANNSYYFEQPWLNNCVSLGQGYCNLPELLICTDRILESQLLALAPFLPIYTGFDSAQKHYAMHSHRVLNDAIDSVNLLVSEVSPQCNLTPNNATRAQLFESSAALHQAETAMINPNCWGALMFSVGIKPASTNALAQARPAAVISQKVKELLTGA